ncbi:copper homeostasis protein CutC [Agrobacterium larrymoorei]|nr:copper homeostasis protein CutC [Agrobacterium larrymoorei]
MILEVCVDDIEGLNAAITGGADRIELCSALALGGLTPSAALMRKGAASSLPCYAMIRPRSGDFVYTANELSLMRDEIEFAKSCGVAGVVFGANLNDGSLDLEALAKLSRACGPLPKTLHRCFDLVPDLQAAIEIAIECGFERILTSGRAPSANQGIADIKVATEIAAGRISIMPGAGVNLQTLDNLLQLDVLELHSSCSTSRFSESAAKSFGFAKEDEKRTDAAIVAAMKKRLSDFKGKGIRLS